jgi:uncharacterized protein (DUF58 family)
VRSIFKLFYTNLFLTARLFTSLFVVITLFVLSFFFTWLADVPSVVFLVLVLLTVIDLWMLYRVSNGIFAQRQAPERLSNGDENQIGLFIENYYPFTVRAGIIDEIPFQFQKRDVLFNTVLEAKQNKLLTYILKPSKRGEYDFGKVRVYIESALGLVSRRYNFDQAQMLPVYPSFLQMRRFELMAISNRLSEYGIKRVRRVGNSMEFEQIKNYVPGDDYRTLNWKASARRGELMVNTFTEEKSQHVYCVIDKSRSMKMPFDGLSLLDYAINASLVLSSVALIKEDKAGLITLSERTSTIVPAERRPSQLNKIIEVLYKEKTRYLETNLELLYGIIRNTLKQRSLVMYFTNYESLSAMERQLPYLKRIARFHLLLVVFFENTELQQLSQQPAKNVEGIYIKTIAEKFAYEKKLIVKELARHGIQSILTTPQNLTVNTINRYLELKARQKI